MGMKKGEGLKTAFDAYVVQSQIGAGGSGSVYEVSDSENARFAVKVLDMAKASGIRLKRFKNETDFCSRNSHKNIIRVFGAGLSDAGAVFYVMPLYPKTLRDLMSGGIEQGKILPLFGQILDGVEAAHLQGIWHRDLKPENILSSPTNNSLVVADFGIAHFGEEELLTAVETKPGDRLANFIYAAPEQKIRGKKVDQRADVYALGLILHEMFTREVPLGTGHQTVTECAPDYAYLDALIELMRNQDPGRRPLIGDVKEELVARGNQFIEMQRLSKLKSKVVPESEVSDPIIDNPIRIVEKLDYRNGTLSLRLNQPVGDKWIACFQNRATQIGPNVSAAVVHFGGDRVSIHLPEHCLQEGVRFIKQYLPLANEDYAATIMREHHEVIRKQRVTLQTKIAQEEARQKLLAKLQI